jgi:hypothetical protein
MTSRRSTRRRLPEWLIGLLLAVILTVAVLWVLERLGAGDDPSFEGRDTDQEGSLPGMSLVLFDGADPAFGPIRLIRAT